MPYPVENIYHNFNFKLLISLVKEEDFRNIYNIWRNRLILMFYVILLKVSVE
jgi:hypothetical protein